MQFTSVFIYKLLKEKLTCLGILRAKIECIPGTSLLRYYKSNKSLKWNLDDLSNPTPK